MTKDTGSATVLDIPDYIISEGPPSPIIIAFENFRKTGGIQTLVRLLVSYFLAKGHPTLILGNFSSEVRCHFPQDTVCNLSDKYDFSAAAKFVNKIDHAEILILCFSANGAAIALRAVGNNSKCENLRLLLGTYHPRVFGIELGRPISSCINTMFARSLDRRSIYFMNDECKISNIERIGKKFCVSNIIPLPVIPEQGAWVPTQRRTKIVSIGRLTDFKAYNFCAAQIACKLQAAGVDIEWDIYGHGEQEWKLKESLVNSSNVFFKGPVTLADYASTCLKYDLFIGMGTAAVQAASLGVPTLLAIDNEGMLTHGYAFNAPHGNVGEKTDELTPSLLSDAIAQFVGSDSQERERLSSQCKKWSSQFYPEYLLPEILENLKAAPCATWQNRFWAGLFWIGLSLKRFFASRTIP